MSRLDGAGGNKHTPTMVLFLCLLYAPFIHEFMTKENILYFPFRVHRSWMRRLKSFTVRLFLLFFFLLSSVGDGVLLIDIIALRLARRACVALCGKGHHARQAGKEYHPEGSRHCLLFVLLLFRFVYLASFEFRSFRITNSGTVIMDPALGGSSCSLLTFAENQREAAGGQRLRGRAGHP